MFETVTVDEALSRGKRTVNYPAVAIIVLSILVSIGLLTAQLVAGWFIVVGIICGFILGWLYWSIQVTKWRLWAFENVRNVHELKKRAVKEQIIWPDGNFFEKTEFRSAADKEKLNSLAYKFNQADIFTDDFAVPAETEIRYSRVKSLLQALLMLALCLGGVYLIVYNQNYILGSILAIVGAVLAYIGFSHVVNKSPQVIINNKGIATASIPFCSWNEIENEDVIIQRSGKTSNTYFTYTHPGGEERVDVGELDISKKELEKLLRIYRGRSSNSR